MNTRTRTIASFFSIAMAAMLLGAVVTTQVRTQTALARPAETDPAAVQPVPDDGDDARVTDGGEGLDLAADALELALSRDADGLERHRGAAIQGLGAVDDAHAAAAQYGEDLVPRHRRQRQPAWGTVARPPAGHPGVAAGPGRRGEVLRLRQAPCRLPHPPWFRRIAHGRTPSLFLPVQQSPLRGRTP